MPEVVNQAKSTFLANMSHGTTFFSYSAAAMLSPLLLARGS